VPNRSNVSIIHEFDPSMPIGTLGFKDMSPARLT